MKTASKAIMLVLCVICLVVASVMGTLAYLTDNDSATNTFTVGKVGIELDETDVDEYGVKDGETRVKANEYKLLPGHTYIKDPIVHVDADSESSYIRLLVTMTNYNNALQVLENVNGVILLENYVEGWDSTKWEMVNFTPGDNTGVYEFRYYQTVSTADGPATDLPALFTAIKMPGSLTNSQILLLNGVQINVVAHAMQADGFGTADAAWAAFPTT